MRRNYLVSVLISLIAMTGLTALVLRHRSLISAPPRSVNEFGPLKLGALLPWGPGDRTIYAPPDHIIPASTFYIFIAQRDLWCISDGCGLDAAQVETMGGFLEVRDIEMPGEKGAEFGFDDNRIRKKYDSVTIIGDQNAKMVGIYPNQDIHDLIPLLKQHPDVINFDLLQGVDEFGPLKVGAPAPLKPGDPTGYQRVKPTSFPYPYIPANKKFYVFSIQQDLLGAGYCAFWECKTRKYNHYNYTENYVEELGGWFSSDGTPETARKFGLDPARIATGEASLVVVTDSADTIVAIHPGKTIKDILSILRQHPKIADVEQLFVDTVVSG